MAPNPNPARIAEMTWRFVEYLLALHPGSLNGGVYAYKAGSHNTRANLYNHVVIVNDVPTFPWRNDYSIRQARDKLGPADKSAGIDWTFPDAQRGDYRGISLYGRRIHAAFLAHDPRLDGWFEALGNIDLDGTAEGFAFDTWQTRSPDSSHAWHWHFGVHRDVVNVERVYAGMLSILRGESLADWLKGPKTMAVADDVWAHPHALAAIWRIQGVVAMADRVGGGPTAGEPIVLTARLKAQDAMLAAMAKAIGEVDDQVAERLTAEFDAIKAEVDQVADEAMAALAEQSPEHIADALRAALGERATAVGALLAAG